MGIEVAAMTQELQKALEYVKGQIASKLQKRAQLDAEIAQLQATEIGLRNALGQQIKAEIAWTDLVRAVLNSSPGQSMSAVEVRNVLAAWGYDFKGIQNPLAFINTILQRLSDRGEIVRSAKGRPFRFGVG